MWKRVEKRRLLLMIMLCIFLGIFLFSGWKILGILAEYRQGTDEYAKLAEQFVAMEQDDSQSDITGEEAVRNETSEIVLESAEETAPIKVSFTDLQAQCGDVVGWIYCEGTPINYPVVQSENNSDYLYRMLDGTRNSSGSIFMDCRNASDLTDWNTLIYGHNMKNGAMFGCLDRYREQEFYEEHPVLYFLTPDQNYRIDLVGGYTTTGDSDAYRIPEDQEERDELIKKAKSRSSFSANVDVLGEDRLITLSTCVYEYDDARYVLVGALRKIG